MNFILILGEVTVKLLDLELQEVSDWFGLGLHLDIPPPELYNIKHNITLRSTQEFRTEMFSVWMRKLPEPTWPRVVKALMEIGRERLAHKIALKYGKTGLLYISISSVYMSLLRDNFSYIHIIIQSLQYTVGVPVPSVVDKKLPQLDTSSQV